MNITFLNCKQTSTFPKIGAKVYHGKKMIGYVVKITSNFKSNEYNKTIKT